MNRKKLTLFILVIVLVLAVIWSYARMPRQATVSTLKYAPGQQAKETRSQSPSASAKTAVMVNRSGGRALRLDLLNQERPDFKGYRRNIFKPIFVDEIKQMKIKLAAAPPVQPVKVVPVPAPVQPAAVDTPKRELTKFTFLGYLKKDNRQTIFLSKEKDIFLVKSGDTFGGRYTATNISEQALTIKVAATGEEIVIPLIENSPLRAAK